MRFLWLKRIGVEDRQWLLLACFLAVAWVACGPVVLITPYDEVTDTRLQDYRDDLDTFVSRAGASAFTEKGTFEAAKDDYAALEAKIDGIISRVGMLDQGLACKLDNKTWQHIKSRLAKAVGLPPSNSAATGDGTGCILKMLQNVQANLASIKGVHQDPQKCASTNPQFATCLRPAMTQDALDISNQTIDAVTFIEAALKKDQGSK